MINKLSVREAVWDIGTEVDDSVGSSYAREAPHLVVLIHGFNVSEHDASCSYGDFRARLGCVVRGGERRVGAVWEFHWPGDLPSRAASALTYPVRVVRAKEAGQLLAGTWLAHRTRSKTVVLIAHSLGCRVALEAVREIRRLEESGNYSGPNVAAIFLLAAAVPVAYCSPDADGRFGAPLRDPVDPSRDSHEYVFHSRCDLTLKRLFDTGQALVPEPGHAVGRSGLPDGRWTDAWRMWLGHRKYWRSEKVAVRVAAALGLSVVRPMGDQQLAVEEPSDDHRSLPARFLVPRFLQGRSLR